MSGKKFMEKADFFRERNCLIQNYYGMAIRNNIDHLDQVKQAVWAIYFHKVSTDDKQI